MLTARLGILELKAPFRIFGHLFESVPVLIASLSADGHTGNGEAAGVYYLKDTPARMMHTIEMVKAEIEKGLSRQELRRLLPCGGARNAIDCAMWELEALSTRSAVWQLAGIPQPRPLVTTMTLGADDPDAMAKGAIALKSAKALKLKLTGSADLDEARVREVRRARPDVWLGVDANQGFTPKSIEPFLSTLADCRVSLLEQPFARGREIDMRDIDFPVPTAADESCLNLVELEEIHGLFDIVNIKLDKCGGLTEALMMAKRARELGMKVMVGNMIGSSLAMAPGFVLGQLCDFVDLDGPISLVNDPPPTVSYINGEISCPLEVWGGSPATVS